MKIQYNVPSEENTIYRPGCFDNSIGKKMMVKIGRLHVQATIVSAVVAADGRSVLWTVDIPRAPEILANPN